MSRTQLSQHSSDVRPMRFNKTSKPRTISTPAGINIVLVRGSIAEQTVDVIVNTVGATVELRQGAVSNSILQAAGSDIQYECAMKWPKGAKYGEVLVTLGYELECKNVYHVVCQKWDDDRKDETIMRQLIAECLRKAHERKYSSIAFPAIGTGNLSVPREVASRVMYDEVGKFSQSIGTTFLRDIRFVIYDKDIATYEAFEKHIDSLVEEPHVDSTAKMAEEDTNKYAGAFHEPTTTSATSSATSSVQQSDDVEKTIRVSGVSDDITNEDIYPVFESKRNGGGPVSRIQRLDRDTILVTFESKDVSENIVTQSNQKPIRILGKQITISPCSQTPDNPVAVGGCKILVTSIPADLDTDDICAALENWRKGGGQVDDITKLTANSAIVTFADEKVAKQWVQKGELVIASYNLVLSWPTSQQFKVSKPIPADSPAVDNSLSIVDESPLTTVEIRGIKSEITEEQLKLYFESERSSGGGEITDMQYYLESGMATVCFRDPKAVQRLLTRKRHVIAQTKLELIALESLASDLVDQECAVIVTGFPRTCSEELLINYFGKKKKVPTATLR